MKSASEFGLLGLLLSTLIKVSTGLNGCRRELVSNTTLTTELQSDVLLPCYFKSALLRSYKAEDIVVVWSQINTAAFDLLRIEIDGDTRHWESKDRRIRSFPEHSLSDNFSVILHKAQLSDQGLFRCELFKGINCSIAYQELNLSVTLCRSKPLARINIATKLQSDVLLPCYFKPATLGSDKTADIAAVWSHSNITTDNLLEIKLQGKVRNGNIRPFPESSESGNFSILLHKVQQSDLGLYRCELFRGNSCTLAYQDVYVSTDSSMKYWHFLLGAAVALCLLLVSLCCMQRRRRDTADALYTNTYFHESKRDSKEEAIYENDMEVRKMKNASRGCCQNPTQENSIYVNWERKKT
ncbi:uncharacterized protein LOC118815098 [Colossoma macropomum]|uniref:uncharacterized protein LOC118815098 n=1 Tax=Colossoma macropomum TaxID=42526 RepID=UPI001865670F|nr:uncharacterized protein LOC118815098 [Colossoma macropomum]